ncbi:MAG TPA: fluoride efflux transporter CrcB [Bacteroidales bacterium]|jgi:CrcB protein|nr:fluoride efflux transporter CrcB [Bacteroidales bacterium]
MLRLILLVGTGGFLGTVSRFLMSRYVTANYASSFPFGTFAVNILGCLLIGIIYGIAEKGDFISSEWRLFLTVGFCGGFTTFSAFAAENMAMLRDSEFFHFFLYTGSSIFVGLLATFAGIMITKIL